jgi:hypothetical protein
VDQHDGRVGAGDVAREAERDNMQPHAPDLNKFTSWRMSGFKLPPLAKSQQRPRRGLG